MSTVIFANPDGFKGVEMTYKNHWLDEEGATQNPNYIWENETTPQSRKVTAVSNIQAALDEVLEIEVRRDEYVEQHKILQNVKRVQIASEQGSTGISRTTNVQDEGGEHEVNNSNNYTN